MATIYQEQPRTDDGTGVGLVAGLVLVLAVIALVFLATRAAPEAIENVPSNIPGIQTEGDGSVNTQPQPRAQ